MALILDQKIRGRIDQVNGLLIMDKLSVHLRVSEVS